MEHGNGGSGAVSGKQHGELYYFWKHVGVFLVALILCVLYDLLNLHPVDCGADHCNCGIKFENNIEFALSHMVFIALLAQAFAFILMDDG